MLRQICASIVTALSLTSGACQPVCTAGFPTPDEHLALSADSGCGDVDGEAATVTSTSAGGRVIVELEMPTTLVPEVRLEFEADPEISPITGSVVATTSCNHNGEGDELGAIRLVDDNGLWFEGGTSEEVDGETTSLTDWHFVFNELDGGCQVPEHGGLPGTEELHQVLVRFDDDEAHAPLEGIDGQIDATRVRAIGLRAYRATFNAPPDTSDGFGPGSHIQELVTGYAYRRQ